MISNLNDRGQHMVLGALVADAAALGLHWIYDQPHIRKVAPVAPEFTPPRAENYENTRGYFAHADRVTGQQSQYGEQVLVMLRALAQNDGKYSATAFVTEFHKHFGYGGAYVGYIDHATRDTLDNLRRAEDDALTRAKAVRFDGDKTVTLSVATKALALMSRYCGEVLRTEFEKAVRLKYDDDRVVAHGNKVLEELLAMPAAKGAVDRQLPAIAKLPGLVANVVQSNENDFDTMILSAIRATNAHEDADEFGLACAHMMSAALDDDKMEDIVSAGRSVSSGLTAQLIDDAVAMTSRSTDDVTAHFGMACDLRYGVPSVIHNLLTAPSFQEAVRRNIYAGGDSCGRAIFLGAIAGAVYGIGGPQGIPQDWIAKLAVHGDLT